MSSANLASSEALKRKVPLLDWSKLNSGNNQETTKTNQLSSRALQELDFFSSIFEKWKTQPFNPQNEIEFIGKLDIPDNQASFKSSLEKTCSSDMGLKKKIEVLKGLRLQLIQQIQFSKQISQSKRTAKKTADILKRNQSDCIETSRRTKHVVSDSYKEYLEYSHKKYDQNEASVVFHRTARSLQADDKTLNGQGKPSHERNKHLQQKSLALNLKTIYSKDSLLRVVDEIKLDNLSMKEAIDRMKEQIKELKEVSENLLIQNKYLQISLQENEEVFESRVEYLQDLELLLRFLEEKQQKCENPGQMKAILNQVLSDLATEINDVCSAN